MRTFKQHRGQPGNRPLLWRVLLTAAVVIAGVELAALVVEVLGRNAPSGLTLSTLAALAILRILVAPVFVLAFVVSGIFAPSRVARLVLFGAAAFEAASFLYVFVWNLR